MTAVTKITGGGLYSYLACHISTVSQQTGVYCFTHGLSIQLYIKTVPRRRFSRENKISKMCTAIQRSGYQHNISTVSPLQLYSNNTKIQIKKVYDQIAQAHYINNQSEIREPRAAPKENMYMVKKGNRRVQRQKVLSEISLAPSKFVSCCVYI
jgi:hypothetical protein